MPTAPVAYVSADRQVRVIAVDGRDTSQTSTDTPLLYGGWRVGSDVETHYSWPTWSPDGTRLACFRLPTGHRTARAVVLGIDSVTSAEVADLDGRLPIYLQWSPDGRRIAALTQRVGGGNERLHLSVMRPDHVGQEIALTDGAPLFFTWARHRVAAFVGSGDQGASRLAVLDPNGAGVTRVLPGSPGNFCAPIWLGDRLLYVVNRRGTTWVVTADERSDDVHEVEEVTGLVALVLSPDGRYVARAVAPHGDGTPYRKIAILDVASGKVRAVADEECLAFHWCPAGDALVLARVDTARNLIEWHRLALDGRSEHFADLYPTRDFGFYLRFFEQYTQSHPLVDPTGATVLLAGKLYSAGINRTQPHLWEVPVAGGEPRALADGVFGAYGPVPEARDAPTG